VPDNKAVAPNEPISAALLYRNSDPKLFITPQAIDKALAKVVSLTNLPTGVLAIFSAKRST
jgi:hypothetical protein